MRGIALFVFFATVAVGFVLPPVDVTSRTALYAATPLTNVATGKKITVPEGSNLGAACSKLGIKVPYNCKKGDCGTCSVSVGGKILRACTAKVPPAPKLKSVAEKGLPVKLAR
uniref:2Fe-2S ferredoxin-type domain-containing protein n=1 Tax=Aureoumbra lagunensis TaxID=44058 RepID=A0A7S3NPX4_9STRA|mmetsp:Transcript_20807/g.26930  ORF Transcript_20807/g.26930 Transcript_20807/m.26930 type:complete len:113 (+) Transcript_20807:89-427(+)